MALTFIPRLFKNLDAVGSGSGGGGLTNANNGLSVSGTTAQLGGNLIKDTTIDGAFYLDIGSTTPLTYFSFTAGISGENSVLYLDQYEVDLHYSPLGGGFVYLNLNINEANLSWQDALGAQSQIYVNTLGIGIDTISNGAWFSYLKNDNTTTDRTFQFPDNDGTLALTSDFTASNGLTKVLTDFKLGGTLTGSTTININAQAFRLLQGANVSVDFGDGLLYGTGGIESIDYVNRFLKNSTGAITLQWSNASNGFGIQNVGSSNVVFLKNSNLTSNRTYEFINRTGTLALRELNIRSISATDTALTTDDVIEITANTFTLSLYTAVGNSGKTLIISNQGTGVVTVDASGSETINGSLTKTLNQYDSLKIVSNGTNWIIG